MPRLDVIIVDWNSGPYLRQCLDAICRCKKVGFELSRLVIVDNASANHFTASPDWRDLPLRYTRNSTNRGFAAACNQGAFGSQADYLLFLNPDTRLHSETLTRAISFMEEPVRRAIGICGVRHVDDAGRTTISCARFPSVWIFLWKMTGLARLLPNLFPTHLLSEEECRQSREVDQVIGAFFLVRRPLFEVLRGFDERFFMYFEEVDFSLRAKSLGYSSYYLSDVTVYHRGGGSSELARGKRLFYSLRSRLLYAFKHFSWSEALMLSLLTTTVEMASRLFSAALSLSFTKLNETVEAYAGLFGYFMGRGTKWRS